MNQEEIDQLITEVRAKAASDEDLELFISSALVTSNQVFRDIFTKELRRRYNLIPIGE